MQISLTSILSYAVLASSAIIPQVHLDFAPVSDAKYGYAGPGTYRIISLLSSYAVSLNSSNSPVGVVSLPPVTNDDAQRWVIADISSSEKLIINNGTGWTLSSIRGQQTIRSTFTPPYDTQAHWTLDFDAYQGVENSPVVIRNVGRAGTVLDLRASGRPAGTEIITFPLNQPKTPNQAWLLEYLG